MGNIEKLLKEKGWSFIMAGKVPLITRSKCPRPPECRSLLVSLDPGQHQSVSASLIAGNLCFSLNLELKYSASLLGQEGQGPSVFGPPPEV